MANRKNKKIIRILYEYEVVHSDKSVLFTHLKDLLGHLKKHGQTKIKVEYNGKMSFSGIYMTSLSSAFRCSSEFYTDNLKIIRHDKE